MTNDILLYMQKKITTEGFKSKEELEFFKIATRSIEKQMEIEEVTKDWRKKIDPEDKCKKWLMYGIMESFLIDKDLKNYSFTTEIKKMNNILQRKEKEI